MANNTKDQPGRAQPNQSEKGTRNDPSKRQGGFDDQRKDEVSSPPAGGVDPEREGGEEQTERRNAENEPNPEIRKS